ncbi:MAG: FAD-dependent oxidoreductase [Balneolaceae bacterium]|nr:MAG: FAD-dependent oxidoreductase [Balneolaceae bacterium]
MRHYFLLTAVLLIASSCKTVTEPTRYDTDVLIAGGGASGVMASIQAARMGVDVIIVEQTDWLGGMLTAAGVSAIDGNHRLPSGLWGEFRSHLYDHYGGPDAVETGWVSNTLFEPHIGNHILHRMVEAEPRITVIKGYYPVEVIKNGDGTPAFQDENRVAGVLFRNADGEMIDVRANITIEATEYGDLLPLAGAGYRFGFEPRDQFGEPMAPEAGHDMIQDLTYVAILKDFGEGADKTVERTASYEPSLFDGTCRQLSSDPDADVVDCGPESGKDLYMLNYGRLPNDHYMINWPIHGNDIYIPILEMTREQRYAALELAKEMTLNWIHFIQTEGGYRQFGLAEDIFPTADNMPLIPYIRESRRVDGVQTLTSNHIINPFRAGEELYKYGIAVGDYPLDLHHERKPVEFQTRTDELPKIPSYNVPWGTMVPNGVDGLIVAEKSISVTHVANGATRLQPVVILLGQAAGAAAALAVSGKTEPRDLDVRAIQSALLESGTWLVPYVDITPDDPAFMAVQRVGLSGVMKGEGVPEAWANRTFFYPDEGMSRSDMQALIRMAKGELETHENIVFKSAGRKITRAQAARLIWEALGSPEPEMTEELADLGEAHQGYMAMQYLLGEGYLQGLKEGNRIFPDREITRKQIAMIVDKAFDPFYSLGL